MVEGLVNVVFSQSMSAECQVHHFHKKDVYIKLSIAWLSLDVVGFLLFLPV